MTSTDTETTRRSRREGGGRRGGGTGRAPVPQLARRKLTRLFPAMEIVSADELESIHRASLKVLSEIGMDFTLPEARDMLKKAGAKVDGERVRFDPAMIEELISSAPSEFTFHARNPENDQRIGGNAITFGTVASPPNSADMDADAPGGSLNLKSKSAFQRKGRYFAYSVYGLANSYQMRLGKFDGPNDGQSYKIQPGIVLDYSDTYLEGKLGLV